MPVSIAASVDGVPCRSTESVIGALRRAERRGRQHAVVNLYDVQSAPHRSRRRRRRRAEEQGTVSEHFSSSQSRSEFDGAAWGRDTPPPPRASSSPLVVATMPEILEAARENPGGAFAEFCDSASPVGASRVLRLALADALLYSRSVVGDQQAGPFFRNHVTFESPNGNVHTLDADTDQQALQHYTKEGADDWLYHGSVAQISLRSGGRVLRLGDGGVLWDVALPKGDVSDLLDRIEGMCDTCGVQHQFSFPSPSPHRASGMVYASGPGF
eukprot:TRINITY_DN15874_c0_g1_i1.p1 TRINITY_DN15874_c0_g1~~TRINITY_DN15874_c0_g1_i1.p1  ORF type:complete len:285 (+),score=89.12 TRINITY_DN15874_c0_g1_i1:46-855(+)